MGTVIEHESGAAGTRDLSLGARHAGPHFLRWLGVVLAVAMMGAGGGYGADTAAAVQPPSPGDPPGSQLDLGTATAEAADAAEQAMPKAASGKAEELPARIFRLDPGLIGEKLERLEGQRVDGAQAAEVLRRYFEAQGIDLGPIELGFGREAGGGFQSTTGRKLVLNVQTGVLFVQASARELEGVERVLRALDQSPQTISIEAWWAELSGETPEALRLDWLLEDPRLPLINTNTSLGSDLAHAVSGVVGDPSFREAIQNLDRPVTNVLMELRGDGLEWGGKPVTNAANIRLSAALGPARTGLLTEAQYHLVRRVLEQRPGVQVLSAPRVTARSGRSSRIEVVDRLAVLTGINPEAIVRPGIWGRTNVVTFTTAPVPVGPTLDLLPVVAAEGRAVEVILTPTLTAFVGYDPPLRNTEVRVWQNGVKKRVHPPLPRFRVCQMETTVQVPDGLTLALATAPMEAAEFGAGDTPDGAQTLRAGPRRIVSKRLLVFVTPRIGEPAARDRPAGSLPGQDGSGRAPEAGDPAADRRGSDR